MAALFTTMGPVEIFIKPRINGTLNSSWTYFGTSVTSPEVEIKESFLPVMNDLGGRSVPTTQVWDGEQHVLSATLNRFDPDVYAYLRTRSAIGTTPVTGEKLQRGRLFIGYNDCQCLLVNSFKGGLGDTGNMPAGRLYYSAKFAGSRESSVGSRVYEIAIILEMNGVLDPATRLFSLYTEKASDWGTVTTN